MDFSSVGEKELQEYLDFLLGQYRLADAFWFLAVEETFGTEAAVKLNEDVWIKIAPLAAREIKSRFAIEGEGVPAVMEALSYFPWTTITGYEITQIGDRTVLRAPHCPPQEARLRHGLYFRSARTLFSGSSTTLRGAWRSVIWKATGRSPVSSHFVTDFPPGSWITTGT